MPLAQLSVFALPSASNIDDRDLHLQVFSHHSLFERDGSRFKEPVDKPTKQYGSSVMWSVAHRGWS